MAKTKTAPTAKQTTTQPADQHDHAEHSHSDHAGHDHSAHAVINHSDKPSIVGENITFELAIPWAEVQKEYAKTLQRLAAQAEIKGFRIGKAPIKLVEEKLGKEKIYDETVSRVLSPAYADELKKRNIRPLVEPHVHPKSMEENADWVFTIETAEYPTFELGDYKDIVKTAKAKDVLWTPGKEDIKPEENTEDKKMQKIFQALLEKITVRVPELLIRQEVNHSLSRMVQQLDRLHLTLEDYLKSISKTAEEIRQEFAMNALTTLQVEFILNEIAKAEKLEVSDKEIDDIIQAIPDEKIRQTSQLPGQRQMVASTLMRRKVVERLLSL